jgi:uncharacterized protein YdaU (DUF1376 family)
LPLDHAKIAKAIGLRTEDQKAALEVVLEEKFARTENGYVQARVAETLARYHARCETNSKNRTTNRQRIVNESSTNRDESITTLVKPITKNQEPSTKNQEPDKKEKEKKEKNSEAPHCPPLRGGQDSVLKEKETKPAPPKGTRLNPDWIPKPETIEQMRKERPDLNYERTLASFHDYWIAKPGKDGVKLDWEATFRNWFRNERAIPAHAKPFTYTKPVFKPAKAYQSIYPPFEVYTIDEWEVTEDCYYGSAGIRNKESPSTVIKLSELKALEDVLNG